jgi:hypothetical protein
MVKIITIGLKVRQFKERKRINLIINQNQLRKDTLLLYFKERLLIIHKRLMYQTKYEIKY